MKQLKKLGKKGVACVISLLLVCVLSIVPDGNNVETVMKEVEVLECKEGGYTETAEQLYKIVYELEGEKETYNYYIEEVEVGSKVEIPIRETNRSNVSMYIGVMQILFLLAGCTVGSLMLWEKIKDEVLEN